MALAKSGIRECLGNPTSQMIANKKGDYQDGDTGIAAQQFIAVAPYPKSVWIPKHGENQSSNRVEENEMTKLTFATL
ncbi:MAG: hypothetical protein ACTSX7_12060, partial [Alphaproteobacteria bacterium]